MAEISRIRFNPGTKEIEIEGSESFVKTYFGKIQAILSGVSKAVVKEPKVRKGRPAKKATKTPKAKIVKAAPQKSKKAAKRKSRVKKVTNMGAILALIQGSKGGIATTELKEKTGLTERQTWGIVARAAKEGRIRKVKRGVYAGE